MFKKKETTHFREYRLKKDVRAITGQHNNVILRKKTNQSSLFSAKQILSRNVQKTEGSLPSSPRKKAEVTETLAKKSNLRIAVHNKSGRKKNKVSEEEE